MEDCRYYEELIGAELDGELTDSEMEALHAHLETCETCRAYREALRAMAETAADSSPSNSWRPLSMSPSHASMVAAS